MSFTVRLEDHTARQVGELVAEVWPRTAAHEAELLRRVNVGGEPGRVLDSADACAHLAGLIGALERAGTEISQSLSPAQWLFLLRRLPYEYLSGRHPTTGPVRHAAAEVLSARSTASAAPVRGEGGLRFEMTPATVHALTSLVVTASAAVTYQAMYRACAKGATLRLSVDGRHVLRYDDATARAVELYDRRISDPADDLFTPTGARLVVRAEDVAEAGTVMGAVRMRSSATVEVDADLLRPVLDLPPIVDTVSIDTAYGVACFQQGTLRAFQELTPAGEPWWGAELSAVLACMRAAMVSLDSLVSVLQRGYALYDHESFTAAFHEADPDASWEALLDLRGSFWPLIPGPVIRLVPDGLYVDLLAATAHLRHLTTVARRGGGRLVNLRASHFERDVQEVIDASAWRPGDRLRALRGRALRVGGRTVTDLDAVGERDGVLLAVSAKSVPYSPEYDSGEHAVIRNLAARCDSFVAEWESRLGTLIAHRSGDNYDFSGYGGILGLVCLPFVPYCHLGPATAEVRPGLRAVSSVAELAGWLNDDL
ncbi:hypothetical protein [Nonomuraea sp. NPDC005501]|uniref:hypothetical protein n=1 Tax=Nonomuraea sp. NPDC005501 TaxID=3156884 RepID=UPI0033A1D307